MDFQEIRYEVDGPVLTITLNRPERLNAYTGTMHDELMQAFDLADADDAVRAIVVTGEGRGFCAGADLERGGKTFDWRERQARGQMAQDSGEEVPRDGGGMLTLRIFDCKKFVIAAINGPAVGVGITMTLPDGRAPGRGQRPDGLRVRPPGDRDRGLLQLVPAPGRGHLTGDGVGWHRSRLRRGRGAGRRSRAERPPGRMSCCPRRGSWRPR